MKPVLTAPALKAAALTFLLLACTPSAWAQSGQDDMQDLLKDLDALIEKGASERLADPWFLDDLRALSNRYGETWPVVLMDHRFDSQGSLPKAPWEVRQGDMKMDWSRGLRSRVEPRQEAAGKSDEEVVGEIIGGLLGQALGTGQGSGAPAADPSEPALALAPLAISNAFRLDAEVTARALAGSREGAFELGVYQNGNAGYRLVLEPQADGGSLLSLLAVSSRGSTRVIESATLRQDLLNDSPFTLTWTRSPNGAMGAALNEEALFSTSDNSFRDAFSGVMIGNRGGDYAVRWLTLRGTR